MVVIVVPPKMVGCRLRWRCYVETSTNPTEIDITTSDFVVACDRYSRIIWLCLHRRDSNKNKVLQLIDDSIRWEERFALIVQNCLYCVTTSSWLLANHHQLSVPRTVSVVKSEACVLGYSRFLPHHAGPALQLPAFFLLKSHISPLLLLLFYSFPSFEI